MNLDGQGGGGEGNEYNQKTQYEFIKEQIKNLINWTSKENWKNSFKELFLFYVKVFTCLYVCAL